MKRIEWKRPLTQRLMFLLGLSFLMGGCIPDSRMEQTAAVETKTVEVKPIETRPTEDESIQIMPVTELPQQYDARENGSAPSVKDQGNLGTCWAFASLMALQSTLLPDEVMDFSEDHMSNNPNFTLSQDEGGEYTMAMAYLLSWRGPVLESEDPYGDGTSPEGLEPAKHVQEVQLLPAGDIAAIKRAVYECGGVQSSLYTNLVQKDSQSAYYNKGAGAYYCPDQKTANHDIVIIGWDDTYRKELFSTEPPENGAFLCANSWGPEFGIGGYFYVSYYDVNIGRNNILYSLIEEPENYDYIYQSDLCGWIGQIGYGKETAWATNVYTAIGAEQLEAVGFYATERNTEYEVYVTHPVSSDPAQEGFKARKRIAKGSLPYAGFYTIKADESVVLEAGERFGITIRLTTPGVEHPIAIEYDAGDGKSRIDLTDGEGYISANGEQWQSVEQEQNCNICLKAYTTWKQS